LIAVAVLAAATAVAVPTMSEEDQIREAIAGFVAAYNAG